MTPREADVAFVLEGVEGVREAHAFRDDPALDFAIRVDSISALHRFDAVGAERVTLVANPDELEFADRELRLLGHFCTFLERPLDVETLAFLVTHGALYVERWTSPVPAVPRRARERERR